MKIVSGGQTGADRAALDFALENGFDTGGWVPRGRRAEDGRIPDRYPGLVEAPSADPAVRTVLNVRDADATLIVSRGPLSGGSLLTLREAERLGRPVLHLDLDRAPLEVAAGRLQRWLDAHRPGVLNVAGPRASRDAAIAAATRALLDAGCRPGFAGPSDGPVAPPRIDTARLVLARPGEDDAGEIFERYASDAEVTRYLSWPTHRSVADTRAFLDWSDGEWARWPAGPYLVRSRDTGRLLGGTGLSFAAPDEAMAGYVLARDAWGRGYATEALGAMIGLAWSLGVVWLFAVCHPAHRASAHVLEKQGFVRDPGWTRRVVFPNLDPGRPQDVLCYARSKPD
jgi:RimJ/RimL family protein N-acetyltransferase